jgi:hypothetical protein
MINRFDGTFFRVAVLLDSCKPMAEGPQILEASLVVREIGLRAQRQRGPDFVCDLQ